MNHHDIPMWLTLLCTSAATAVLVLTTWATPQEPQRLDADTAKALDKMFRERLRMLSKR